MRFTFTEKKVQVSDEVRAYAERKIGKLDKFFRAESDAYITFSFERGRYRTEVTLRNNGMFYRVTESTGDVYASLDSAVASIERQIRKNKTRLEKRLRVGALQEQSEESAAVSVEPEEEQEEAAEETFEIVRSKRFSVKPMSPEEAVLQMNLLGHEFFAFRNQEEDGEFAIVYRRISGGYGLINCKYED